MGDHLSRLIGRSRGAFAAARPVVAPLFAPAAADADVAVPAAAEVAPRAIEPAVRATPLPLDAPRAARVEVPRPIDAQRAPPRRPDDPPATPTRRASDDVVPAESVRTRAAEPSRADAADAPPRVARDDAPHTVSAAPLRPAPTQAPAIASRRDDVSVLRPVQPARPSPARRADDARDAAGEARPVIRVTIGRIEVRAVAPPPAAPRVAAPRRAPRTDLEQYLRPPGARR